MHHITSPLELSALEELRTGNQVSISGIIYVARDAAHKRMIQSLDKGEGLPIEIAGQTLYYMGPSPAKPGQIIGSAGPTTSGRMDIFTPRLLSAGLRAMIGKGSRSPDVREAIKKHRAVYMAAIGGAGALIAKSILKAEVVAYEDLGTEAIRRIEVKDFPAIVINDIYGGDLYEEGKAKYKKVIL
ncbi:Fe-S-containing hydro-lyase [Chloroflexota bacterium]